MPELDIISKDYVDEVTFLAVAGRSDVERSRERAPEWFGDQIAWGYDDSVWQLYGIPGQPVAILITADDKVFATWFGRAGEEQTRAAIEALIALHG